MIGAHFNVWVVYLPQTILCGHNHLPQATAIGFGPRENLLDAACDRLIWSDI